MVAQEVSRAARSKAKARTSYDRLSRWYDLLAHGSEWPLTEQGLGMLGIGAGERVLEIGPGTGHALAALARAVGPAGLVCGLDLSAGMLAVARGRARQLPQGDQVHLVQGSAVHLPWASQSFEAAFMSFTLELFPDPEIAAVLGECRRVLRPAGRLGVVALGQRARDGLMARLYGWAHRTFPRAVDCRPIAVRPALQQAGFRVVAQQQRTMWGLPVDMVLAQSGE